MRPAGYVLFATLLVACQGAAAQPADLVEKAERGKAALAAGRFDEAAQLYGELVEALPADAGMRLNLGMALVMAGRPRQAVPHLERAVKLRPDLLPAQLFLGAARVEIGDAGAAIAPLEKVVAAWPDHTQARRLLAEALLARERFDRAATGFRRLAEATPDDPAVWYGLARSYEGLARAALETLERTFPGSPYALALRAEALAARERHAEAFELYRQALEKLPARRELHDALVDIYEKTGHADWAAQAREKAAAVAPPACDATTAAGEAAAATSALAAECHFRAGRYELTVAAVKGRADEQALYWRARAYDQLATGAAARLAELPPSAALHEVTAALLRERGRYLEAADELRKAAALAPGQPRIEKALAEALYLARDYAAAKPLLEELARRDPQSAEIAFLLGETLAQLQEIDAAIPILERAVALDPQLLAARGALARAYLAAGRPEAAVPHLEAALPIDEDGALHYQLARAYQATGRAERAKPLLEKYQELQRAAAARAKKRGEGIRPPG
jgi:tetratricopeptide (TPR) repeat protein